MRGKKAKKREVQPDIRFGSVVVTRLINQVMWSGKKAIATDLVYRALENIDPKSLKVKETGGKAAKTAEKVVIDPSKLSGREILEMAITNIKPNLEIRSRRIGGANYQIPVPVAPDRQLALAMRWLVGGARENRKNTDFAIALKKEIEAAFNGEGQAVKKKEDTQKMAEANKAFAQFS